jgi:hypothetical protein
MITSSTYFWMAMKGLNSWMDLSKSTLLITALMQYALSAMNM